MSANETVRILAHINCNCLKKKNQIDDDSVLSITYYIFTNQQVGGKSIGAFIPVKILHFLLQLFFIVFRSSEPHTGGYVPLTRWRTIVIE